MRSIAIDTTPRHNTLLAPSHHRVPADMKKLLEEMRKLTNFLVMATFPPQLY
jgi:hypothetical protein